MLEILAAPFAASLVLAGIHCYLGLHVLMREVIFVDLALAQIAALGVAAGTLAGVDPHGGESYLWGLGATLAGAAAFSVARSSRQRVSQEAFIGITYATCAALTLIVLSRSPTHAEEVLHMLVGRLLFVGWDEVALAAALYLAVAVLHVLCRRPLFAISQGRLEGMSRREVRGWDFLFYASFGVVVASSVHVAGVLLVFSLLVVPAACASLLWTSVRARLLAGWAFGVLGCILGVWASAGLDLPTGASVVTALGLTFGACTVATRVARRGTRGTGGGAT